MSEHPNFKSQLKSKTLAAIAAKGYVIGDALNSGSFATVYAVTKGDKRMAVKIINLETASAQFTNKFLPRELSAICKLNHPNIIKPADIIVEKDGGVQKKVLIFMDRADKGDLLGCLSNGPVPEEQAKKWAFQIADALDMMHNEDHIAHRDLKLENILINSDSNAVLCDFGFSRDVNLDDKLSGTYCGSLPYVAPEIVNHHMYDPFKADCWSLGIIIFSILQNSMPFDDSDKELMKVNQKTQNFSHQNVPVTAEASDLIKKLLEPDPQKRLDMKDVLKHPWFNGLPKIKRHPKTSRKLTTTTTVQANSLTDLEMPSLQSSNNLPKPSTLQNVQKPTVLVTSQDTEKASSPAEDDHALDVGEIPTLHPESKLSAINAENNIEKLNTVSNKKVTDKQKILLPKSTELSDKKSTPATQEVKLPKTTDVKSPEVKNIPVKLPGVKDSSEKSGKSLKLGTSHTTKVSGKETATLPKNSVKPTPYVTFPITMPPKVNKSSSSPNPDSTKSDNSSKPTNNAKLTTIMKPTTTTNTKPTTTTNKKPTTTTNTKPTTSNAKPATKPNTNSATSKNPNSPKQ